MAIRPRRRRPITFPDGSRFVEVGNFLGRSLCSLGEVVRTAGSASPSLASTRAGAAASKAREARTITARPSPQGGGTFAGTLHRNIIECGYADSISLIVADSVTAADFFADQSIDWVHLDARHDREHVKADIAAWLPKIKADGWLSGDDYDEVKWPEVVSAVQEPLPEARPWSIDQWRWMVR